MPPSRFVKLVQAGSESPATPKVVEVPQAVPELSAVRPAPETESLPRVQISVSNFRCWENTHTWTIPRHHGLVLIHAPSGAGKSSILSAINWALSGKVAINSCSWGKKRMTAQLSWFPHHPTFASEMRSIYRCNTPRQFRVAFVNGHTIENAEAEAYLSEQVGIPFPLIAQLSQLSQKLMGVQPHLMQMPQADKSVFLQQLFVPDANHKELVAQLRAFCKDEVKSAQSQLCTLSAKVVQGQSMVDELARVLDEAESMEPDAIQTRLERLNSIRNEWQVQVARERKYDFAVDHLRTLFESSLYCDYTRSLLVPFDEWVVDWYSPGVQAEIDQLLEDCTMIGLEHRDTVHEIEFEQMRDDELAARELAHSDARAEVVSCSKHVVGDHEVLLLNERVAHQNVALSAHKDAVARLQQHEARNGSLPSLVAQIKVLDENRSLTLSCPSCSTAIEYSVDEQAWVVATSHGASPIDTRTQLQRESERIRDKQRLDALVVERRQLQSMIDPSQDPVALAQGLKQDRERVDECRAARQLLEFAKAKVRACEVKLTTGIGPAVQQAAQKARDQCLPPLDRVDVKFHKEAAELYSRLAAEIANLKPVERALGYETWTVDLEQEHARLQTQLTHARTRTKLVEWRSRLFESRREAQEATVQLEAALSLDKLGRDAELRTLQQHLLSLNVELQALLDNVMFQEGAEMQCGFEVANGTTKPEVSMALLQRGQPCDERCLSGGEYDRLALAVSLALYRLFAVKLGLLCLDESLSSLDAEVANGILMRLHDDHKHTAGLTVMVDHHGGTGMFHHVVELEAAQLVKPS